MSKRSEAKARKAKAQMFKSPDYYVGKRFTIVSSKNISAGSVKIVQVFCEDEYGNEINFSFSNPAATQQTYRPGEIRIMVRSSQGGLVDYVWLGEI